MFQFDCSEGENISRNVGGKIEMIGRKEVGYIMNWICWIFLVFLLLQNANAAIYHVNQTGNDLQGNGSAASPWRTLRHAVANTPEGQGHIIRLSIGTFIEDGPINVPPGISIEGAGRTQTIIKAANSFYYYPANPGYATDRFLIRLAGYNPVTGNQSIRNLTIDGDEKKLHGGILVNYRNNVTIENVEVRYTNFSGIWLWDVKDILVKDVNFLNCSWGSTAYCVGALNLGNLERVDISGVDIDEDRGYGIKAIGPSGYNNIFHLKIHDSRISVHPNGLWNNGSAPNIAIELWQVSLVGCELYNCYVDNTISLVNSNMPPSTGVQSIRVHHNILDMETRSNGSGYGIELSLHDVEIDHNYFIRGTQGIANWDNPCRNWNIHHNIFYGIQGMYPGEVVRSQWSGLHNVKFVNNTIEFIGTRTANVIGLYGGTSSNLELKNNLIINSNTAYNYYQNQLIRRENGATVNNLQVTNNLLYNLDVNVGNLFGSLLGILDPLLKNITTDPQINRTGARPQPYYAPRAGSPLINGGVNVGYSFNGTAPDIGAIEYASTPPNTSPQVSIASPANNTSFTSGTTITIQANASDSDGTIGKVEFFNGTTKLGEDVTSPYSFTWNNVPAGNYTLTARATDNVGAVSTSAPVSIQVNASANQLPVVTLTNPTNNSIFTSGATIMIRANASDSDGAINKVEFFYGATKLGEDLISPYSFAWTNVPAGNYTITAQATDNAGAKSTSTPVSIRVNPPANQLPVVTLTSPASNAVFAKGTTIAITAEASDADGSISKVEFFSDTVKLGESLTHPHSFFWDNAPPGIYTLTAKVYDNRQATAISDPVLIMVGETDILLYPNVAKEECYVQFFSWGDQQGQVTMVDLAGRIVSKWAVQLQSGLNNIKLDVSEAIDGLYIIRLQTETGRQYTARLIIMR